MPTLTQIKAELKALNVTVTRKPATNEWRVNYINGLEATAYYTTEFQDAVDTGRAMGKWFKGKLRKAK